jgi:hypothetical protein
MLRESGSTLSRITGMVCIISAPIHRKLIIHTLDANNKGVVGA